MVRYLKVKIRKHRTLGTTGFRYPEAWDAQKIGVLAYEDHPENLGDVVEHCIAVTEDDAYGTELLSRHPDLVEEIDLATARVLIDEYRPRPADVTVTITRTAKEKDATIVADVRALLENKKMKKLTYRIEET